MSIHIYLFNGWWLRSPILYITKEYFNKKIETVINTGRRSNIPYITKMFGLKYLSKQWTNNVNADQTAPTGAITQDLCTVCHTVILGVSTGSQLELFYHLKPRTHVPICMQIMHRCRKTSTQTNKIGEAKVVFAWRSHGLQTILQKLCSFSILLQTVKILCKNALSANCCTHLRYYSIHTDSVLKHYRNCKKKKKKSILTWHSVSITLKKTLFNSHLFIYIWDLRP